MLQKLRKSGAVGAIAAFFKDAYDDLIEGIDALSSDEPLADWSEGHILIHGLMILG